MAMGTVPSHRILARLENLYEDPPDSFREQMRAAAQTTLDTLTLAQLPAAADRPALLRAARHLDRLRFGGEISQIRGRAQARLRTILDQLVSDLPETAPVVGDFPETNSGTVCRNKPTPAPCRNGNSEVRAVTRRSSPSPSPITSTTNCQADYGDP